MLVVLVERHGPRHLLRRRVDLDGAAEVADRRQQLARDLADRPIGRERDAPRAPVAVLGHRLVGVQVERDDERARAVGRRQRECLPAACASAAARRAGAAARAAPARPRACRAPACARGACRTSRSTPRRAARAATRRALRHATPLPLGCLGPQSVIGDCGGADVREAGFPSPAAPAEPQAQRESITLDVLGWVALAIVWRRSRSTLLFAGAGSARDFIAVYVISMRSALSPWKATCSVLFLLISGLLSIGPSDLRLAPRKVDPVGASRPRWCCGRPAIVAGVALSPGTPPTGGLPSSGPRSFISASGCSARGFKRGFDPLRSAVRSAPFSGSCPLDRECPRSRFHRPEEREGTLDGNPAFLARALSFCLRPMDRTSPSRLHVPAALAITRRSHS